MLIKGATVLGEDFVFRRRDIAVEDGVFRAPDCNRGEMLDGTGLFLLPGLVDIHTHGAAGCDNMDPNPAAIDTITDFLARHGVTTYLAAILTQSREAMGAAAENIAAVAARGTRGAKLGGIYMEGPYFSAAHKGAQNEAFLRNPDLDEFRALQARAAGLIRIVSLAPERRGAADFIRAVTKGGVRAAIGHTDADYETAMTAIAAGATDLTHTFNGMRDPLHRAPNAAGAAIDGGLFCECIADGVHVHPAMIRMLYHAVGRDRLVLISDALRAAGMPDGDYELGGQQFRVRAGRATLPDGTIAGSTATLFSCVQNAIRFGIPPADAVRAASLNPARAAGIADRCGVVADGRCADFLLVDRGFNLHSVYIDGKRVTA